MRKEMFGTGRSIEEALENACASLGVRRGIDEYEQEIIDLPQKGLFGIGAKPARVRVWIETPDETPAQEPAAKPARQETPKPAAQPAPEKAQPAPEKTQSAPEKAQSAAETPAAPAQQEEKPEKPVDFGNKPEVVRQFITDVLAAMNLEGVTATVTTDAQSIRVQIDGDEHGVTIGRRGETLDALQTLTGLAANRGEGDFAHIVLDSGTYRDKRRRTLENLAKRLANNAVRTGRSTTLEPMNPYDRRIIHASVSQVEGATSTSIGEEPNRCVVISSKNPRPQNGDGENRRERRGGRGGRGGDRRGGRDGRGRRPKPEPYHESGTREVAPAEAKEHSLYGKVEI